MAHAQLPESVSSPFVKVSVRVFTVSTPPEQVTSQTSVTVVVNPPANGLDGVPCV